MFIPLYDYNPMQHLARPYVNYGLIAVTVMAFFLTGGFDVAQVERAALGLGLVPAVVHGMYELPAGIALVPSLATYVTYAFLHADAFHLGGNMLFLWVFGDNIEDAVGHLRYLVFYLVCAVLGGLTHALVFPDATIPLIGASGAVAGVVGAYLLLHPRVRLWVLALGRIPLRLSAGIVLALWALMQILMALASDPDVDRIAWWAHVGGFVAGMGLILVLRRQGVPLLDRPVPEDTGI